MAAINRRSFLERTALLGAAGMTVPSLLMGENAKTNLPAAPFNRKNGISLAEWALVDEIFAGKWKNLDFPRIAREDFGLGGIEFVNTLFEVPTAEYLAQLKRNAEDHGVEMILIMVDAEGDPCAGDKKDREQFAVNHRKWVDIAAFLGCHAIRTNCRGNEKSDPEDALKWAADSYGKLLEYSIPANISVLIENHGGFSNDAEWMVKLMKKVDNLYFGSYPDWREPDRKFDNYNYLEKMLPWAHGMSYRNQPTEELSAKMIRLCLENGYSGWFGIESSGREAIMEGKRILEKYLAITASDK
ncbi:MAG: TIM barrel protein [Bacteroidota bacterium]